MTRRTVVATTIGVVLALTGCVTPAFDSGAFRQNARGAVGSGLSETATAELVVRQVLQDRVTDAVADTSLSGCEDAIGPIEDSFGKVQPPHRRDDPLRSDVLSALGDADEAIADARIAARRHDTSGLRQALHDLEATVRKFEKLEQDLG
ncbi:hypothetical protein N5P18_06120 [Janibacter terrae]|jgi:hypothetical protein|uniref:DUF305 domain-containing protein n=1 Tax=Janibacter terrae TaxID=103817 RepID=A0ABZ2FGK0_9MICO|nr:hypothetical protein [Janibacter terrae]MBA4083980.1 hypothetical protein [Kytococcus sp.]